MTDKGFLMEVEPETKMKKLYVMAFSDQKDDLSQGFKFVFEKGKTKGYAISHGERGELLAFSCDVTK